MPDSRRWLAAALVVAAFGSEAGAQAGLGQVEDATVVPRGVIRLRPMLAWSRFDSRFTAGGTEPLGAPFTSDSLGARQIAALATVDSLVSAAIAGPYALSLGRSRLDARGRTEQLPIALEYGVTNRITIGVMVPVVRRRVTLQWQLDSTGATAGPNLNRTLSTARQTNALVQTQFSAASAQLQARLSQCQADNTGAGCAALLARRIEAEQLIASSRAFALTMAALFGDATSEGMAFVPRQQSGAAAEIGLRIASFNAQYRDILGSGSDLLTARPAGAGGPAGTSELQRFFISDLEGDSLATEERTGIGNVEVGVRALLLDRPVSDASALGVRMTAALAARFATGSQQSPSPVLDLRLDHGQPAVEGRLGLDLQAGRVGLLTGAEFVSLQSGGNAAAAGSRGAADTRAVGLHLAPRFHLSPPMSFHGAYSIRTGDASGSEQLVGGGVAFLSPGGPGRAGALPIEMRYTHLQSLSGPAGQPRYFRDQLEVRIYYRVLRGAPR